jgi:CDP-diacylglycerol---serine O-phosphatidyltransferase
LRFVFGPDGDPVCDFGDNFGMAVLMIGTAAALDGLDGRLARMLKSESAIGAELDSLCDFVNFGVTPAIVLYLWASAPETSLGWIAVLVYVVCCMLRLARFNVGSRRRSERRRRRRALSACLPCGGAARADAGLPCLRDE